MSQSFSKNFEEVSKIFPFKGYLLNKKYQISNIIKEIECFLQKGSKILDVGSGPCDITSILSSMGYECSACDDLQDDWHNELNNKELILEFAKKMNVNFHQMNDDFYIPFEKESFDLVMSNDVLEHLHESPKEILKNMIDFVKPGGKILITVPNAVNIKKRINVLFGRTNLPPFDSYYWHKGDLWRGHIREYVKNDLIKLSEFNNLKIIKLEGCDHMLQNIPSKFHRPYLLSTLFFKSLKDSWILIAEKS